MLCCLQDWDHELSLLIFSCFSQPSCQDIQSMYKPGYRPQVTHIYVN